MDKKVLEKAQSNLAIFDSLVKADSVINNPKYKSIICSISGGADSDVMMDLIYKVDTDKKDVPVSYLHQIMGSHL